MNCQNHPDMPATAYCRTCGKALCEGCRRNAYGTVFCDEHAPVAAPPPPVFTVPPVSPLPPGAVFSNCSPTLALILGLAIPGVGAIYNGQYAKGLVHAVVFGLMVSIIDSGAGSGLEPLLGLLLAAWIFYMGFEAFHTASKRRRGEPVDEFSSLIDLRQHSGRFPMVGVVLIILGVILLLNTLGLLELRYLLRYWPVVLIAAGAYLLYARIGSAPASEVRHER